MTKQDFYRIEYKKLNPEWRMSPEIFRDKIDALVRSETKILDVGCGHGDLLKDIFAKTQHSYGIDPDANAVARNRILQHASVATVEKMPFEDDFFDVVALAWVVEHLEDPKKAFAEIFRVLKPGGKVVFLTPNAWNYNVWIIRAIPDRFHDFLTRRLYGRQERDTYPVKYRMNTPSRVRKIMSRIGFQEEEIILNGDPSYVSFNRPIFWLALLLEKVIDFKPLNFCRVHIIGIFKK